MSHPAASIKSIFSGKVNLTDSGLADVSDCNDGSGSFRDTTQSETSELTGDLARKITSTKSYHSDDDLYSELSYHELPTNNQLRNPAPLISTNAASDNDNYSVSSRNLKLMMMQKGEVYDPHNSSTNISLASSGSDYQAPLPNDTATCNSDNNSQNGAFLSESFSRPLSRNSTTSCLSTTATKDGVEGKKLHRHGPTPYFSSVIANMLQQQQNQQQQQQQQQQQLSNPQDRPNDNHHTFNPPQPPPNETANPHPRKQQTAVPDLVALPVDDFLSVISQANGEQGNEQRVNDYDSLGLPPVTLKEKMMLLNPDLTRP